MRSLLPLPALLIGLIAAGCASHQASHPTNPTYPSHPSNPSHPSASASLTGTAWHLVELDGHDTIDDSKASLTVSREGRMGGNTGCNAMFGHAMLDGNHLSFETIGSTKMACTQDGVMEQERRYFEALKQVVTWRIDDDHLYLTDRAHKDVLVYEPK